MGYAYDSVKTLLEVDSQQRMDEYLERRWYERAAVGVEPVDSRNGFYERDYGTPWGIIRFRVRRKRAAGRHHYNHQRPHRALGYQRPEEFATQAAARRASPPTPLALPSPGVDFSPGTYIMIGPRNGGRSSAISFPRILASPSFSSPIMGSE
jgi:hypothetical protein